MNSAVTPPRAALGPAPGAEFARTSGSRFQYSGSASDRRDAVIAVECAASLSRSGVASADFFSSLSEGSPGTSDTRPAVVLQPSAAGSFLFGHDRTQPRIRRHGSAPHAWRRGVVCRGGRMTDLIASDYSQLPRQTDGRCRTHGKKPRSLSIRAWSVDGTYSWHKGDGTAGQSAAATC